MYFTPLNVTEDVFERFRFFLVCSSRDWLFSWNKLIVLNGIPWQSNTIRLFISCLYFVTLIDHMTCFDRGEHFLSSHNTTVRSKLLKYLFEWKFPKCYWKSMMRQHTFNVGFRIRDINHDSIKNLCFLCASLV